MSDGGSLLDQRLEIETPERVVLVHDLAGIGSRFAAGTIDACVLAIPWTAALCGLAAASPFDSSLEGEEAQALAMAAAGVIYAIFWLYFLLLESLWGGRTVGKRLLRLRVMSVHGGPAPVSAVVLRNVVRVVDSLPTLLLPFLGGLVMFLNRRSQRIGDLVAGTVVVRERPETRGGPLLAGAAAESAPEDAVSGADLADVDRFLERRHELLPAPRARIAAELAARLAGRYALPAAAPETLLGLVGARRTPREIRDLAGPSAPPRPPADGSARP